MTGKPDIVLGVIPARGGSKGVKKKNIRHVMDKPLIAYAIECGLKCSSIDRLIVSTDCQEIATVAKHYGAEVPFIRPAELADDSAPMLPVMQHAIQACESYYHCNVNTLVLLDPTGPLRSVDDIDQALSILAQPDCDAVISGNEAHRNPYFNMVKIEHGYAGLVLDMDNSVGRRQDAPKVFDLNTVVWAYTRSALMEEKARIPKRTKFYKVPIERSVDIDSEFDFELLEIYMDKLNRKE